MSSFFNQNIGPRIKHTIFGLIKLSGMTGSKISPYTKMLYHATPVGISCELHVQEIFEGVFPTVEDFREL
jgi:hypothetical protein